MHGYVRVLDETFSTLRENVVSTPRGYLARLTSAAGAHRYCGFGQEVGAVLRCAVVRQKGEARVLGCALVFKVVVLEGLLRQPSVWPAVVQRGVQPQPLPLLYQLLGMRGLNSKQ